MPRSIGPRKRAIVWKKTTGKCWYCGTQTTPWEDFTVDHLDPKKIKGTDEVDNLIPCCRTCNARKGPRNLETFRGLMTARSAPPFTEAQRAYLASVGHPLPDDLPPPPAYIFWFEQEGLA